MAHFAGQLGANIQNLIALTHLTPDELCQEECLLDNNIYNQVLEKAVKETKDPYFGLHAGENLNLAAAGLIAQLTQTCDTVHQALEMCCEFANLGCSSLPCTLIETTDDYKVVFTPNTLWNNQSPIAVRHTTEGVLAFTIKEFQSLTRQKHSPIAIHLPWSEPAKTTEYVRVFQCPIFFNQPEIALLLHKEHVAEKITTSDFNLFRILIQYAQEKSEQFNQTLGFTAIVKQSVIKLVKPEFPTVEEVAGHLNISTRTLQRKLQEENCTFNSITSDLKKELAQSYLRKKELNISDIAYLLDYTDVSTFSRMYKKWTGVSPLEYRNSQ